MATGSRSPAIRRGCVALALAAIGLVMPGVAQASPPRASSRAALPPGAAPPAGMPAGVPPAALRSEPALPVPAGWPFPDAFPRTSGTGRLVAGAFEWSDFLYDDHGAKGTNVGGSVAALAPPAGTYTYASPAAAMNGADIFRAAVGWTTGASWWRVDWNTLVDPSIPIAEFALDTDNNPSTGGAAWPASAGIRSAGIDKAIVISARGAWLISVTSGSRIALGRPTVDTAARSFLVRIPTALLPVGGTWRVRLASGVATQAGDAFAPVPPADGRRAGQPAVYNVTFRTASQEGERSNYWMDAAQAAALATGDVSGFSATIRWRDLQAGTTTAEPLPTGYTNRWYVSSLDLGQGVTTKSRPHDVTVNFLGRVQPYSIYVPTGYTPGKAVPLTWLLHSLDEQHNQYGSLDPKLVTAACEQRTSICVTPLGRGPGGWYFDEAEVDFWEVWNRVAAAYSLDPGRTVISGYSMGGWGTYKLGLAYPQVFSKAVALEAAPICGTRPVIALHAAQGPCTDDGDSVPVIDSARNLPFVISQGAIDELAPLVGAVPDVARFFALGYRLRFELYPTADHLLYPVFDEFAEQAAQMNGPPIVANPAHVTYTWYPVLDRPDLGIGSMGAYWISHTKGRNAGPGVVARVDAVSAALPNPAVSVETSVAPIVALFPGAAIDQHWSLGRSPTPRPSISMTLTDVGALTVDLARAGVSGPAAVTVTTDGPVTVTLVHGQLADGGRSVRLDRGTHTISVG